MTPKMFGRAGYVYLLRAPDGTVKIGRSKDPAARVKSLSILPVRLKLLHWIATNDTCGLEGHLHRKYRAKRVRGEWFALSDADVLEIRARDRIDGWSVDVLVNDPETNRLVRRRLWGEMDEGGEAFLRESLRQRQEYIRAEIACLRADLTLINARLTARGMAPIEITLDFAGAE